MSQEQALKGILYSESQKMCREVGMYLDVEFTNNSLDLISELVWKKLQTVAIDLDAFQKHAKRSTITSDDVKLLSRRNKHLKQFIENKLEEIMQTKQPEDKAKAPKRKRKPSVTDK